MNSVRTLERLMNSCREIDVDAFPMVACEELGNMENMCCYAEEGFLVFLYLKSSIDYGNYVDVYIWDCNYYPYSYDRFVICDGYSLPEELENTFLQYINDYYLSIEKGSMVRFCNDVIGTFPEWHFRHYSIRDVSQALEHLYYASHRSGIKEILYKADLANIAFGVDMLPHYNMIGTTPSAIVNSEFPLRFLRLLDNGLVAELFDEERAELNYEVYKRYSGFFENNLPNKAQWRYLVELYLNEGIFMGRGFSRSFYNMLSGCDNSLIIDEYLEYMSIREELEIWGNIEIPEPDQLSEAIRALRRFKNYRFPEDVAAKFEIRNKRESLIYTYSNEKYMVLFPETPLEMCREAMIQRNCLLGYVSMHANRETTVLYIRRCGFSEEPFVTMEVKNLVIMQVRARFNVLPDINVLKFVKEYAEAKGLYLREEEKEFFKHDEFFAEV